MTRTLVLVLLLVVDPAFAVDPDATATAAPSVHSDPSPEDTADVRRMAWTAYLRAESAQRLSSLRRYAARGRFPEKLDQPGFHHQFLDSRGTPCAVAFLIGHDGHWPLVRETAQADNDVVIAELRSGPLVDWVLTSGLTMEEVAVIQVPGFTPSAEPAGIAGPKGGVGGPPGPLVQRELTEEERARRAEQVRIRRHLAAMVQLLEADTEASIAKALDRLGDRVVDALPPSPVARAD